MLPYVGCGAPHNSGFHRYVWCELLVHDALTLLIFLARCALSCYGCRLIFKQKSTLTNLAVAEATDFFKVSAQESPTHTGIASRSLRTCPLANLGSRRQKIGRIRRKARGCSRDVDYASSLYTRARTILSGHAGTGGRRMLRRAVGPERG